MKAIPAGNSFILARSTGLDSIRSGDFLYVKVIDSSKGRSRIIIGGRILSVKSATSLEPGTTVRMKAEWVEGRLVLKPATVKSGGITASRDAAAMLGLGSGEAAAILLRSMKREELPFSDKNVRLAKKILDKKKHLSPEDARAAAVSLSKGLGPEAVGFLTGGFDGKGGSRDRDGNAEELLFNSFKNRNNHWMVFRIALEGPERLLEGSYRLRIPERSGAADYAVLEIHTAGYGRIFFVMKKKPHEVLIRIYTEDDVAAGAKKVMYAKLTEKLGNLPVKIDDNVRVKCFSETSFDGFTEDEAGIDSGLEELV